MIFPSVISNAGSKFAGQATKFTVTIDETINGSIKLSPTLPADGMYEEGTVVTVTATPSPGYAIDALYFFNPGEIWHDGS